MYYLLCNCAANLRKIFKNTKKKRHDFKSGRFL